MSAKREPPSAAKIIIAQIKKGRTNAEALAAARKVHPRTTYSLASVNYYRNGLRAKGVKVPSDREARRRRT